MRIVLGLPALALLIGAASFGLWHLATSWPEIDPTALRTRALCGCCAAALAMLAAAVLPRRDGAPLAAALLAAPWYAGVLSLSRQLVLPGALAAAETPIVLVVVIAALLLPPAWAMQRPADLAAERLALAGNGVGLWRRWLLLDARLVLPSVVTRFVLLACLALLFGQLGGLPPILLAPSLEHS